MTLLSPYPFKATITPPSSAPTLAQSTKCLLGLSISAIPKPVDDVVAAFHWAQAKFPECAILVGDSLYRITLQIQRGLGENDATGIAHDIGDRQLNEVLAHLGERPRVFRSSEIMQRSNFEPALSILRRQFDSDPLFSRAVRKDAETFVARQIRRGKLSTTSDTAVNLSIKYLLEEIAIYFVLAQEGWLVDVYLGNELPTLAMIIRGEIARAPMPLRKRINISLKARKNS